MTRPKSTAPAKVVWRISESAPMGEWVDKSATSAAPVAKKDLPEVSFGSWVTSSYDLLDGSDVIDASDTLPDDLFDELFLRPRQDSPKTPRE